MELVVRIHREIRAWEKLALELDHIWPIPIGGKYARIQIMPVDEDFKVLVVFFLTFIELDPNRKKYLKMQMNIPDSYPDVPPKFRFLTPMWHPNVSLMDGTLLTEFNLEDWRVSPNISNAIVALFALIDDPEMEHAIEHSVARQFFNSQESFITTSRAWKKAFACSIPEEEADVLRLGWMVARFEEGRYPVARKGLVEVAAKSLRISIGQRSEWIRTMNLMADFPIFRPRIHLSHLPASMLRMILNGALGKTLMMLKLRKMK